ncbi:P2Y purinoceptor 2 [Biomphalaria pfeifferi]|uniref:P2Y purinoceptor 2 n=1 Tax=Biomphalaria pfeifferi TaxID=112525 RepID=A0AAD8B063_BIOPF|nr:P2Y purinoceptor 2 [Biomphalaria pfeifferi]
MLNFSLSDSFSWNEIFPEYFLFNYVFWFGVVATNCLTTFSVVTNLINMAVFFKQGLQERVNFTLFWLSFSDLMVALVISVITKGFTGDVQLGSILVDGTSFVNFIWGIKALFKDLSSGLTMFLSIERCICVVRPLHFNSTFIARHGKMIVSMTILAFILYYLPLLTSVGSESAYIKETNTPKWYSISTEFNIEYRRFNDYFMGFSLCVFAPFVILVCAVLMFRGLQQSSRIRKAVIVSSEQTGRTLSELSKKERRVVKMVFVLAILYMLTSFPLIVGVVIFDYYDTFESEEKAIETRNLVLVMEVLLFYVGTSYGALSIFVYYCCSSSFRIEFHIICCLTK